MQKRAEVELYLFLTFAVVAIIGLTYTMLGGRPSGMWGVGIDCQSQCFGTEPGQPIAGQEHLGGAQLRQCLANCQAGISPEQTLIQECYTCNGGGNVQMITGEDQTQAQTVCEQIAGSQATITNAVPGVCPY